MTTNTKTIDTLVQDMYAILDEDSDREATEAFLEDAAEQFKAVLRRKLSSQEKKGSIRFSGLGRPDCQVWYKVNHHDLGEKLTPQTHMKFLYGDVLEIILLYLAKEAGHRVEDEQREVEVLGVKGHIDAIIDGVLVDVKSASPFAFQKFKKEAVAEDDPFGYVAQLAGYCHATGTPKGGFLAIEKVSGEICFSRLAEHHILANPPEVAIERQKGAVASDHSPHRYPTVPEGKSGNMKLATICSYCDFKRDCWKDSNGGRGLRTFLYSNGPKYLTTVAREPDVHEV